MKKETILKTILVVMMSVILLTMPVNVFAAASQSAIDGFWNENNENNEIVLEDLGDKNDLVNTNTNANTNTNTNKNTNTNTNTNANTNKNTNTNIPAAGLAEDTMMWLGITVLGIASVYAYKKVNEYKNI